MCHIKRIGDVTAVGQRLCDDSGEFAVLVTLGKHDKVFPTINKSFRLSASKSHIHIEFLVKFNSLLN